MIHNIFNCKLRIRLGEKNNNKRMCEKSIANKLFCSVKAFVNMLNSYHDDVIDEQSTFAPLFYTSTVVKMWM